MHGRRWRTSLTLRVASIYQQILGKQLDLLDSGVRRFHCLRGAHRLTGHCSIRAAESSIGKLISALLRLPAATAGAELNFDLQADEHEEVWTRHFPRKTMRSRLQPAANGLLAECIGPARLLFSLKADDGALKMQLEAIRIFGLPWPKRWLPEIWGMEHGDEDRFHFDVGARFHHFGLLVAYSGYLNLPDTEPTP